MLATIQFKTDDAAKVAATDIFRQLGITMTDALNLFLHQVIMQRGIMFPLVVTEPKSDAWDSSALEARMQAKVDLATGRKLESGAPVAMYDYEKKVPYLKYPDGRTEYYDGK
jgi:addiction module RelB/DinJ family antitoxin